MSRRWISDQVVLHLCVDKLGQLGSKEDHAAQGSSEGKESLKTSVYKNLWGLWWQEKLPASQESLSERPTGSQNVHKPTHTGISTRRPNLIVGNGGSDWKLAESRASGTVPSQTPPPQTAAKCSQVVAPPWQTPKVAPLTM